jgi:hypothetical protein
VNIPTLDVILRVCLVRNVRVLPSNWEKFGVPQEGLREGSSTSGDPSYVPQEDQEHLIQQSELHDLVCDLIL